MAIEVRHTCSEEKEDYLTVNSTEGSGYVYVDGVFNDRSVSYRFDISTAIRLSKSIRTEINKAKEGSHE